VSDRSGATPDDDPARPGEDTAACLQAGLVGLGLGVALVVVGVLMVAKP